MARLTKQEEKMLALDQSKKGAKEVKVKAPAAKQSSEAELLPAPTKTQKERAQKCLQQIEKDARTMTAAFYDLAIHIYEAYEGKYAQLCGYANFEEYAEKHLPFGYRQAMNFKECGEMIQKLNIPKEKVERVGMTKFKDLLPSLSDVAELPQERAAKQVEKLLEKGEKKSVRELQAEFQRQRAKPATPERFVLRNLIFDTHQGSIVADALKVAYAEIGAEDNVSAIVHICDEWLTLRGEGGVATTLEDYIAMIERKFHVKVSVSTPAKSEKAPKTTPKKTDITPKKESLEDVADSLEAMEDENEEEVVEVDLDEMDKKALLALLKEQGLDIPNAKSMTEKQLRQAIQQALSDTTDSEAEDIDVDDDSDDDEDDDDALLKELSDL